MACGLGGNPMGGPCLTVLEMAALGPTQKVGPTSLLDADWSASVPGAIREASCLLEPPWKAPGPKLGARGPQTPRSPLPPPSPVDPFHGPTQCLLRAPTLPTARGASAHRPREHTGSLDHSGQPVETLGENSCRLC